MSKAITFRVTKEVELIVPNSWTLSEAKKLSEDICNCEVNPQNEWDLNEVEYLIKSVQTEKLTDSADTN